MGLSAPKNRSKLSHDPNNTTWSRNTSRFGHRILTSQGWTPGSYLGATDAAHASHYTAANASHIRVLLKDDNLGLGARRGKEAAERFGLGGFEGVLGRLNGKSETVLKEEEKKREEVELKGWMSRRWGSVRFVSGGFLVGDKIERLVEGEKKRKREEDDDAESVEVTRKLRRKRAKSDLAAAAIAQAMEEGSDVATLKSKDKKEKKRRKQKDVDEAPAESTTTRSDSKAEKKQRKAERRALKEARRLKKSQRKAAKPESTTNTPATSSRAESESSSSEEAAGVQKPVPTPNPAFSLAGGRHAVRQRYIRQKKMASMDPKAMREIFMVKSGA